MNAFKLDTLLMSLQRWAALMGTGTTESNLFYPLTVVQQMPTGAGGGGKGRPSSPVLPGKKKFDTLHHTNIMNS